MNLIELSMPFIYGICLYYNPLSNRLSNASGHGLLFMSKQNFPDFDSSLHNLLEIVFFCICNNASQILLKGVNTFRIFEH